MKYVGSALQGVQFSVILLCLPFHILCTFLQTFTYVSFGLVARTMAGMHTGLDNVCHDAVT